MLYNIIRCNQIKIIYRHLADHNSLTVSESKQELVVLMRSNLLLFSCLYLKIDESSSKIFVMLSGTSLSGFLVYVLFSVPVVFSDCVRIGGSPNLQLQKSNYHTSINEKITCFM